MGGSTRFALLAVVLAGAGSPAQASCSGPWYSGQVLDGAFEPADNYPELLVRNSTTDDAFVRLQSATSPASTTVFVARKDAAKISFIPPGQYEVRVAFGGNMADDCVTLVSARDLMALDGLREFRIDEQRTETADGVEISHSWTSGEVTLYERMVRRGTGRAGRQRDITIAQFNRQR